MKNYTPLDLGKTVCFFYILNVLLRLSSIVYLNICSISLSVNSNMFVLEVCLFHKQQLPNLY